MTRPPADLTTVVARLRAQERQEARSAVLVLLRAAAPAYQHKATREALDVLREVYDINPSEILESER